MAKQVLECLSSGGVQTAVGPRGTKLNVPSLSQVDKPAQARLVPSIAAATGEVSIYRTPRLLGRSVLFLQRSAGNQAVAGLLRDLARPAPAATRKQVEPSSAMLGSTTTATPSIQRCGPIPCNCSPEQKEARETADGAVQRMPDYKPNPTWSSKGTDQGPFACVPFGESLAKIRWLFWSEAFPSEAGSRCKGCGSVETVWDKYFEATSGKFNFKSPGDEIVKSLRNDDDHVPIEDPILKRIETKVPTLAPRLAGKTSAELSLDDAGLSDVHAPNLVFNNNTRAGGQLFGGVGSSEFGDDTRKLDGTIHLDRTPSGGGIQVSGFVTFKYDHTDGVDFCPGNTGEAANAILQNAVTNVSRIEASGMARDVFVEAHYERVRHLVPQRTFNPDDPVPPGPVKPKVVIVPAVLFDFDSDKLKSSAATELLDALGDAPKHADLSQPFKVRGHTDSKGDPGYNVGLSKRRAETIKTLLETKYPNLKDHIETEGLGASEPVAPNSVGGKDNPEGRRKNRRVEISFAEVVEP
jgi:outer membrane protein OmpA-like peptidoglycan-associated protein